MPGEPSAPPSRRSRLPSAASGSRAGAEGAARSRHCLPLPAARLASASRRSRRSSRASGPIPRVTAPAWRGRLPPAPLPSQDGARQPPGRKLPRSRGGDLEAPRGKRLCAPRAGCPPRSEAASLAFPEPPARLPARESLASEALAGLAALPSPFAPLPRSMLPPRLKAAERASGVALPKGSLLAQVR